MSLSADIYSPCYCIKCAKEQRSKCAKEQCVKSAKQQTSKRANPLTSCFQGFWGLSGVSILETWATFINPEDTGLTNQVNDVPEKGRDATGAGRGRGPHLEPNCHLGSASHPFSAERKGFSPEPTRLVSSSRKSEISLEPSCAPATLGPERAAISISPSGAVRAARGAARARATAGSETSGGAVRSRSGAVRNLPYAKSTVAPSGFGRLRRSTANRGGSANCPSPGEEFVWYCNHCEEEREPGEGAVACEDAEGCSCSLDWGGEACGYVVCEECRNPVQKRRESR